VAQGFSCVHPGLLSSGPAGASRPDLEQNPSDRAFGERDEGGFFLMKKPLEGIASGDSNSDFALAEDYSDQEVHLAYFQNHTSNNSRVEI
jgi:hypothetical protein